MLFFKNIFKSKDCVCKKFDSYGDFQVKTDFDYFCVYPDKLYQMIICQCDKCKSYYMFSFNLHVEWEAIELDNLLKKYKVSKDSIYDFRKELQDIFKQSKDWRVSNNVGRYENGEEILKAGRGA